MRGIKTIGLVIIVLLALAVMRSPGKVKTDQRVEAKDVKEVSSLIKLTEASNLDGSKRLVGTSELKEGKVKYVFTVIDSTKKEKIILFETYVDRQSSLTIPFNSWSNDDKYVFIQANSPEGKNYHVFKADGSSFNDGLKYLDVQQYWVSSKNTKVIDRVSGWAGADLLVTYATNSDGSDSFAYWFVISSRRFMNVREL